MDINVVRMKIRSDTRFGNARHCRNRGCERRAAEHNPQTVVHSKVKAVGLLERLTASAGCSLERTVQATCEEEQGEHLLQGSTFSRHTGALHKPALEDPCRQNKINPAGEEGESEQANCLRVL